MLRKPAIVISDPCSQETLALLPAALSRPCFLGSRPQGRPLPNLGRMSGMWLLRETRLPGLPEQSLEFTQQRVDSCP